MLSYSGPLGSASSSVVDSSAVGSSVAVDVLVMVDGSAVGWRVTGVIVLRVVLSPCWDPLDTQPASPAIPRPPQRRTARREGVVFSTLE
jgi:hypothetical protein